MIAIGSRRTIPFLALLVAAALLIGCESTPGDAAASGDPSENGEGAAVEPAAETPETAALPPEPEIDDDPQRLIGLAPSELRDLLGEPDLVRRESPAQVWQYRGGNCVLDIVFYAEREGDRVTYVEARDRSGADSAGRPCLNSLLRDRLAASG